MDKIILENLNFVWNTKVIENVIVMWNKGTPMPDIAKKVGRNNEETFLLLMDLSLHGRIKKRKGYIWGN